MKSDIHPKGYRQVIFRDNSTDARFLIGSVIPSKETDKWTDGKEYPLVHIEISSASHPFYTGADSILDSGGRVEKFKARRAAAGKKSAK